MKKVNILRKKYPCFVYENYSWKVSKGNLDIFFNFSIGKAIKFSPRIIIENIDEKRLEKIGDRVLNNLVFHLGLIELLSYWKATCSPEIKIKPCSLNNEQIKWWKDLIFNGMGEFFYQNEINWLKPGFLEIIPLKSCPCSDEKQEKASFVKLKNRVLIPVSGGKDSIVTLELFKKAKKDINCFSLNPALAGRKIMKMEGCKKPIIVKRKIDEKLLELNRKGYLNGHTPFSAYLAFLSFLCALIFNYKYIAFSNETSSNEENLKYLGKEINHQYSKTWDFEKKFRKYSKKYLVKNIKYFSFLRPLYEIQVVKIFSNFPKYFPIFISCNEAFKTYSGRKKPFKKWCGKCPKCLFVFAVLYPFLAEKNLISIFKKNLFEEKQLLPIMKELIGRETFKPFECVGTKKESLTAFYLSFKKTNRTGDKLYLLEYFRKKVLPEYPNLGKESKKILNSWNSRNNLPKDFEKILKSFYKS